MIAEVGRFVTGDDVASIFQDLPPGRGDLAYGGAVLLIGDAVLVLVAQVIHEFGVHDGARICVARNQRALMHFPIKRMVIAEVAPVIVSEYSEGACNHRVDTDQAVVCLVRRDRSAGLAIPAISSPDNERSRRLSGYEAGDSLGSQNLPTA